MHPTLFTLGYKGLTIEAFIARLQAAQVKTVVDVRELPLSRKKGFFKIGFLRRLVSPWHCLSARPRPGLPQAHLQPIQGGWQLANLHAGFFEVYPDARCVIA